MILKKRTVLLITILALTFIVACQDDMIGGDRDQDGCLVGAGYSFDHQVGACARSWELSDHEKQVARNIIMVQSYSSFTVVNVTKIEGCNDCYDVTLQRNPIDEYTQEEMFIEPYVIPYREGRINYSYEDSVNDPVSLGWTECSQEQGTICTMEYDPVCAKTILNMGNTIYSTFSNSCEACSSMKAVSYKPGECKEILFVVCDEGAKIFDPKEYADNNGGVCVEHCPDGFDAFMTQIGVQLCIPHYGEDEIEEWPVCERSTKDCNCAKAYETTDEKQIDDPSYRCVPDKYAERLLFRGGLDSLDEDGEQSVMIA